MIRWRLEEIFASERQMFYTYKTIPRHIDYLVDAFLISKASRYDIKGRKYIGANMKYYFTDLGLRNVRLIMLSKTEFYRRWPNRYRLDIVRFWDFLKLSGLEKTDYPLRVV